MTLFAACHQYVVLLCAEPCFCVLAAQLRLAAAAAGKRYIHPGRRLVVGGRGVR